MKTEGDLPEVIDKISAKEIEQWPGASVVPDTGKKNEFSWKEVLSSGHSPNKRKKFVNSLNADGKRILAQLASKATRSGKSAA